MSHDHNHSHAISVEGQDQKSFLWGIGLNVIFVIAELTTGLFYNSIALLTDAGHNISDVASLVLSLVALRLAKKKATTMFTYGFKKTIVLAALTNTVIY